ncbi:hypothetical protein VTP01DRAFT_6814 [Rhizomucor pusillus]|uniref:uncharacterized protein n=1 Tax=Rhizomucor pusillus TaxID=4840 RepID=UPI00374287CB
MRNYTVFIHYCRARTNTGTYMQKMHDLCVEHYSFHALVDDNYARLGAYDTVRFERCYKEVGNMVQCERWEVMLEISRNGKRKREE